MEGERFRDAKVVRDLGDGTTEIEDGRGTHLVVDPGRGIVLPASGKQCDVMPPAVRLHLFGKGLRRRLG